MAAAVWKVNMARLVSLLLALVLALSCVQVLVYGEAPARAEASGEAASSVLPVSASSQTIRWKTTGT